MLTIAMITARKEPKFDWLFDSLAYQLTGDDQIKVIIVDFWAQAMPPEWDAVTAKERVNMTLAAANKHKLLQGKVSVHPPKPNVYQGPYRVTKSNWWSIDCVRNTAICLADDGWIAFLDDRLILQPTWMQAAKAGILRGYGVVGSYRKVRELVVENGRAIRHSGTVGEDSRTIGLSGTPPFPCTGAWFFGCSTCVPLEWMLKINGYDERCSTLSFEDVICGVLLERNGFPLKFDPSMGVVEDRTPDQMDVPFKRQNKSKNDNKKDDKDHTILRIAQTGPLSFPNEHLGEGGIVALRNRVRSGKKFLKPSGPSTDWYDGSAIADLE